MDIRNFFGPPAGGKAAASTTKQVKAASIPKPPPGKAKPHAAKPKAEISLYKLPLKKGASAQSNGQKIKPVQLSSDDEVEVITDSDEEAPTSKTVKGKGSKTNFSSPTRTKNSESKINDNKNNSFKSKLNESKEQKSRGRQKPALVVKDCYSDNKTVIVKNGKKALVESESEDDESPLKRIIASKRRPRVVSDSDDEVKGSNTKKTAKSAKGKKESEGGGQPRKKGHRIVNSDSESGGEEPFPKKKVGQKRKKEPVVACDSDEDPTPKKGSLDFFVVQQTPPSAKLVQHKKKAEEPKKSVAAADFFGGGAVHRTEEASTPATKRKQAESAETEFHDDDDFTKTLEQLDQQQAKRPRRGATPVKEAAVTTEGGSSLASKLSQKVKTVSLVISTSPVKHDTNSNLVPDTPEFKKTPRKGRIAESPSGSPEKDAAQAKTKVADKPGPVSTEKKSLLKWENTSPVKEEGKTTPVMEEGNTRSSPKPAQKKTPPKSTQKEDSGKWSAGGNKGAYRSYLNRQGPSALGSKEIPTGAENCLEGLTFVITGVLESMERDESKSLVERYGGKVTTSISSRTSYVVVGRDPGATKITKAEQCKTKQLDEDGLLELIRMLPAKKSKYHQQAEEAVKKEMSMKKADSSSSPFTGLKTTTQPRSEKEAAASQAGQSALTSDDKSGGHGDSSATFMWVDKHKPASMKQIVGQQGDKSNARKLLLWIQRWHQNRAAGAKPAGRFGQDDGSGYRAALLSGPPGIGKTTTAVLVCQEAGFSTVELNASDKRSKRSLKEDVAEALGNQTLVDYMGPPRGGVAGQTHCVIMDEVDGMAGNEDRGGLQELVQLIKTSRIPVLCICNDRNSIKMRSLANHCFDLRFQRPRLEMIKGALMSIAFKEGLKISAPALQEIILSSNQDIRQCIHNMSMWTSNNKELTYDQAKQDAKKAEKDIRLGIFDVSRKVFAGGEETARMTLNDKSDLFFQDYSFVPLFVHENYASVTPYAAKGNRARHLALLARTAESISQGDLVDKRIRSNGNWNLLPTQAMLSSVIPGEYMRGSLGGMIQFPVWLGKNSSTSKTDRVLQELRTHMALQVTSDKRGLNMDYLPALRVRLTEPLATQGSEGVPKVIQMMDQYDMVKEDFDNILEISKWPNSQDPLARLDSKTKAAFTRQYNKESHRTPYATGPATKKRRGGGGAAVEGELEEGDAQQATDSEDEEESLEKDTMIKASKKTGKASATGSKGKGPAKGKGQGQSKGKGKGKDRR